MELRECQYSGRSGRDPTHALSQQPDGRGVGGSGVAATRAAKPGKHPHAVDLREVLNGIRHLLRVGGGVALATAQLHSAPRAGAESGWRRSAIAEAVARDACSPRFAHLLARP